MVHGFEFPKKTNYKGAVVHKVMAILFCPFIKWLINENLQSFGYVRSHIDMLILLSLLAHRLLILLKTYI